MEELAGNLCLTLVISLQPAVAMGRNANVIRKKKSLQQLSDLLASPMAIYPSENNAESNSRLNVN